MIIDLNQAELYVLANRRLKLLPEDSKIVVDKNFLEFLEVEIPNFKLAIPNYQEFFMEPTNKIKKILLHLSYVSGFNELVVLTGDSENSSDIGSIYFFRDSKSPNPVTRILGTSYSLSPYIDLYIESLKPKQISGGINVF